MRDYSQKVLEGDRPPLSARTTVTYCLDRLFQDQQHDVTDSVVEGLSFEELIGALLQARDVLEAREEE